MALSTVPTADLPTAMSLFTDASMAEGTIEQLVAEMKGLRAATQDVRFHSVSCRNITETSIPLRAHFASLSSPLKSKSSERA